MTLDELVRKADAELQKNETDFNRKGALIAYMGVVDVGAYGCVAQARLIAWEARRA